MVFRYGELLKSIDFVDYFKEDFEKMAALFYKASQLPIQCLTPRLIKNEQLFKIRHETPLLEELKALTPEEV